MQTSMPLVSVKRKVALLTLLLWSFVCLQQAGSAASNMRIVGGRPTTIQRVAYLVNLRNRGKFFCGGTLVSRRFIVTAAHCVQGRRVGDITVVGGSTNAFGNGIMRRVSKIMIPRGFNIRTMHMDVAVLKMRRPMNGNSVQPITLCNSSWRVGNIVQVSGWGYTNENNRKLPNSVQTVRVPIVSKQKCVQQYRREAVLTGTMFCASLPGRRDACTGDSGGPLVYNNQLCGIVSWGVGCARANFPGVYTSVKSVQGFIRTAMKR